MIKELENNNLENEIKEGLWLVDFYADWCGPCNMITPILEELEDTNIIKVNVDLFPDVANVYGVMSIPALIFFKDGKEAQREMGFKTKEELQEIMQELA